VALRRPLTTLAIGLFAVLSAVPPFLKLGSEFMPPLNEGDVLYMPTSFPGISIEEAKRQLTRQDQILKSFPEVESVFGKVGRAETPTDPAPLSMVETVNPAPAPGTVAAGAPGAVALALGAAVRGARARGALARGAAADLGGADRKARRRDAAPGLDQRLDHADQSAGRHADHTGCGRPSASRCSARTSTPSSAPGQGWSPCCATCRDAQRALRALAGRHLRRRAAEPEALSRHGLNVADVNAVLETAVGGEVVTTTVEGRNRFTVNVRYQEDFRSSPEKLKRCWCPFARAMSRPPRPRRAGWTP
jgi:Cu(I)/Ag(I) efflux system membrane protein CusA/SilA